MLEELRCSHQIRQVLWRPCRASTGWRQPFWIRPWISMLWRSHSFQLRIQSTLEWIHSEKHSMLIKQLTNRARLSKPSKNKHITRSHSSYRHRWYSCSSHWAQEIRSVWPTWLETRRIPSKLRGVSGNMETSSPREMRSSSKYAWSRTYQKRLNTASRRALEADQPATDTCSWRQANRQPLVCKAKEVLDQRQPVTPNNQQQKEYQLPWHTGTANLPSNLQRLQLLTNLFSTK